MSSPRRSSLTEIDNIADVLNYGSVWAWMGPLGCGRLLGQVVELLVAVSAKHLPSVRIWAGDTLKILGTGLEIGLVQQFEMPRAANARPNHQTTFCAVMNVCLNLCLERVLYNLRDRFMTTLKIRGQVDMDQNGF